MPQDVLCFYYNALPITELMFYIGDYFYSCE